jgi:vancomycin resistance protein YoaR
VFAVFFLIAALFVFSGKNIKSGVNIEGVSFSGYTKQDAVSKLNAIYLDKLNNSKILLKHNNKTWEIPYSIINARYDVGKAVDVAYSVGRQGNPFADFVNSLTALFNNHNVQVQIGYDKNTLVKKLKVISKNISKPGRNATFVVNKDNSLKLIPEQAGVNLDINKSIKLIEEAITRADLQPVELPVKDELPQYTANELKNIDAQIGYWQTTFNSSEKNRAANIRNALSDISGTILMPGETFSLNQVLGPRSENNGYKSAPVILNDELVPGLGGGICQVATTLYNAAIRASLKVVERHHHTFPPVYVPVGQDATIAGNQIDFKFKNTTRYPLFIYAAAPSNKINIKIFSKNTAPNRKVKIESQILDVQDPGPPDVLKDSSLPSGTVKTDREAKRGYRVAVYRNIYEYNKLVSREKISSDYYKSIKGIVKIGADISQSNNDAGEQSSDIPVNIINPNAENIEEPNNPPDIEGGNN